MRELEINAPGQSKCRGGLKAVYATHLSDKRSVDGTDLPTAEDEQTRARSFSWVVAVTELMNLVRFG